MPNEGATYHAEAMESDDIDLAGLERDEYAFPGPVRDKLVAAILTGAKTETSSLLVEYEREGESLPEVGKLSVVLDSQGREVCVTRLIEVSVVPYGRISLSHALGEGEGYSTVAGWRKAHEAFWSSAEFREGLGDPNFVLHDDTLVICERFEMIKRL